MPKPIPLISDAFYNGNGSSLAGETGPAQQDRCSSVGQVQLSRTGPAQQRQVRSPLADVVRTLLGEHPLLEHVVQCVDGAQLQSLLLMENLSFVHTIYI